MLQNRPSKLNSPADQDLKGYEKSGEDQERDQERDDDDYDNIPHPFYLSLRYFGIDLRLVSTVPSLRITVPLFTLP
jgi:hypothetical protein